MDLFYNTAALPEVAKILARLAGRGPAGAGGAAARRARPLRPRKLEDNLEVIPVSVRYLQFAGDPGLVTTRVEYTSLRSTQAKLVKCPMGLHEAP